MMSPKGNTGFLKSITVALGLKLKSLQEEQHVPRNQSLDSFEVQSPSQNWLCQGPLLSKGIELGSFRPSLGPLRKP